MPKPTKLSPDSFGRAFADVARLVRKAAHSVLLGAPDAVHHSGLEMAELMAVHEYGSTDDRIPERAPIRKSIQNNRDRYIKLLGKAAGKYLDKRNLEGYEKLGVVAVSEIQRTIIARHMRRD